jgi:metal iron transporter
MNCPIRTDPAPDEGHNQNPSDLANEITTNNSLNHRRNSTNGRNDRIHLEDGSHGSIGEEALQDEDGAGRKKGGERKVDMEVSEVVHVKNEGVEMRGGAASGGGAFGGGKGLSGGVGKGFKKIQKVILKYFKFMGPGFMVAVAYIDPGNSFPLLKHCWAILTCWNRQLCDRRSSRCYVPLPPSLHDSSLQHLCHIPSIVVHQTGNRYGHELS